MHAGRVSDRLSDNDLLDVARAAGWRLVVELPSGWSAWHRDGRAVSPVWPRREELLQWVRAEFGDGERPDLSDPETFFAKTPRVVRHESSLSDEEVVAGVVALGLTVGVPARGTTAWYRDGVAVSPGYADRRGLIAWARHALE